MTSTPATAAGSPIGALIAHPLRQLRMATLRFGAPADAARFVVARGEPAPRFTGGAPADAAGWRESAWKGQGPGHVAVIRDGFAGSHGGVFLSDGRLVHGAAHKFDPGRSYWGLRGGRSGWSQLLAPITRIDTPLTVLTASNQGFYFHWLHDVLPRLALLRQAGMDAARPLFVAQETGFQRRTLALMDVQPGRVVDASRVAMVHSPELVVPAFQVMSGAAFPDWSIRALREAFLPHAAEWSGPRRLYLSRRAAGHRRILNEDQLVERLSAEGFAVALPETLSFEQQVGMFADAEAIVAPHGGGLANLVFAPPGTRVVELFGGPPIDLYYRLSHACGLDYRWSAASAPAAPTAGRLSLDDYSVDIDEVVGRVAP